MKVCLAARGIDVDTACPICHCDAETILHALRDCRLVRSTWDQLGALDINPSFFSSSLHDWLTFNGTSNHASRSAQPPWKVSFLFTIWNLWKQRNEVVFRNKGPNPHLVYSIFQQVTEFYFCAYPSRTPKRQVLREIRWERPPRGWVKLNTDGSSLGNPGTAGGGGLVRDDSGHWLTGFSRRIGITSSFMAELWALRDGLKYCRDQNYEVVVVELDAKAVIDILSNLNNSNLAVCSLVDDCRCLIAQIPQVLIRHCYREANRCANKLANMGGKQQTDFISYDCSPVDLFSFVDFDLSGLYLRRLCPANLDVPYFFVSIIFLC